MSQNSFKANTKDRPGKDICNDLYIKSLAENNTNEKLTTFWALNMEFEVHVLLRSPITINSLDPNNADAANQGYTELNTLAAVSCSDKRVYAIWEFYSTEDQAPYLGKAIEVDEKHQKKGIGKSFCTALKGIGFDIVPSGRQTAAGAALLNAVIRLTSAP
jgi:hypothetical protein